MAEFEQRLSEVLIAEADAAPEPARLADGARRRRDRRRRRRSVVGAVAAVCVLAGAGLALRSAGDDATLRDASVVATQPDGWHTVRFDYTPVNTGSEPTALLVDVPGGWAPVAGGGSCLGTRYGADSDPGGCATADEQVTLLPDTGNIDMCCAPGVRLRRQVWTGYVRQDEAYVSVATRDRDTALRVLGSVRPVDMEVSGLDDGWREVVDDGVRYPVPRADLPGLTVDVGRTDGDRVVPEAMPVPGGGWTAGASVGDDGVTVTVTAPSAALAQLIAGSAGLAPSEGWRTIEVHGLRFDVPPDWTDPPRCDRGPAAGTPTVGAAGEDCREVAGAFVHPESATTDFVYLPGIQRCGGSSDGGGGADSGWCALWIEDEPTMSGRAVFVRAPDRAVVARLYRSITLLER